MARKIHPGVAGKSTAVSLPNADITTSQTIGSNKVYWCNTTAGTITLTLPPSPSKGDLIRIFDVANTFDTNNLTVGRNGKPIMSAADNLTVATEGAAFDLVFYDNTQGWRIFTI
jgi:hypothetical protein